MAKFEVKIERITVFPHPNADRLELARVGLYNIVVGKGAYSTGDKVLYIPEYSVLSEDLIVKLGLDGKLAGSNKDRVKPIRLRGELSQGLVASLEILPEGAVEAEGEDGDFADILNITKWEPVIPASMSGDVEGNYGLISWIDIENLKKFPDMFTEGEPVIVDEKIHGTASLFTFMNPLGMERETLVSSKGLASRKLTLKESEFNVYWRMLRKYDLENLAVHVAERLIADGVALSVDKVGVFGETFGAIQDLHYGVKPGDISFAVFDIFVKYVSGNLSSTAVWLDPEVVSKLVSDLGIPLVPRLYEGPFSLDKIIELASGREQVSGTEANIREGVVVRPLHRNPENATHKIGKFVSDAYLTRKGSNGEEPTEFN